MQIQWTCTVGASSSDCVASSTPFLDSLSSISTGFALSLALMSCWFMVWVLRRK